MLDFVVKYGVVLAYFLGVGCGAAIVAFFVGATRCENCCWDDSHINQDTKQLRG